MAVVSDLIQHDAGLPGLHQLLSYRLSVVSSLLSRAQLKRFGPVSDLTGPEWRVLVLVHTYAPLSVKALSKHAGIDFGQTSRLVSRMCELGHVVKTPTDDGRQVNLLLTPSGKALHRKLWSAAMACNNTFLSVLTEAQKEALFTGLDALAGAVKADLAREESPPRRAARAAGKR